MKRGSGESGSRRKEEAPRMATPTTTALALRRTMTGVTTATRTLVQSSTWQAAIWGPGAGQARDGGLGGNAAAAAGAAGGAAMSTMTQSRMAELMQAGRDAKVVVKLKKGHAGKQDHQRRILKSLGLMYVS